MDITNIAVIGAGTIGRGIAYAAASGGYRTVLEDFSQQRLAQGVQWIKQEFEHGVWQGKIDAAIREAAISLLSTAPNVEDAIRDADLIIETVPEEMEVKLELFTIFDKFAKPRAIFASNTTALSIGDFTDVTISRDRCIGMHFIHPVAEMRLTELVKTPFTSEETVAACREVVRRMGKEVAVVEELPCVTGRERSKSGMENTGVSRSTMKPLKERVVIQQGDLTEMDTDAIVNAANNDLILGAGVAGAIARKGGESIQKECDAIGSIPVGFAAITGAGRLKARFVIHAASMQAGRRTTAENLRGSTNHSLRLAAERGLKSIAFPAVGTGVAGFPLKECAEIMLRAAAEHLRGETSLETIYFVLFDELAEGTFERAWKQIRSSLD